MFLGVIDIRGEGRSAIYPLADERELRRVLKLSLKGSKNYYHLREVFLLGDKVLLLAEKDGKIKVYLLGLDVSSNNLYLLDTKELFGRYLAFDVERKDLVVLTGREGYGGVQWFALAKAEIFSDRIAPFRVFPLFYPEYLPRRGIGYSYWLFETDNRILIVIGGPSSSRLISFKIDSGGVSLENGEKLTMRVHLVSKVNGKLVLSTGNRACFLNLK